jgi:hypothetical protein
LIHLGDSNVPNALMFIDKYSQVEHILNPILATVDALPSLHDKDPHVGAWIDSTFGGVQALTQAILADFFRCGAPCALSPGPHLFVSSGVPFL